MRQCLNENLKNLRLACGMNQVALAKELNVTKQAVSNWENDNILPSVETLLRIADFFKVSTDYLLGRAEREIVDVSGLTEEQAGHIRLLVHDLEMLNK